MLRYVIRSRGVALGLALLSLGACRTHGEARDRYRLADVARQPESTTLAVAVTHQRYRPAVGIGTFPDGGADRIIAQSVDAYRVDAATSDVHRYARIIAPPDVRTGFAARVAGWAGDTVYVTISGCPGDECYGAPGQRHVHHFRVVSDSATEAAGVPPSAAIGRNSPLVRSFGERVYVRSSATSTSIDVRLDDTRDWRHNAFFLDTVSGTVRAGAPSMRD